MKSSFEIKGNASRVAFLLCFCCLLSGCYGQRDFQAELISFLKNNITNYSPLLTPALNPNQVVYAMMDTLLSQIVSVDSAKQSIKIAAYISASWQEERLVWDPASFGGVRVVNWDSSQIWFPVILIYNGIGDNQLLTPQIPVYLVSLQPNLTYVTASWRREFEFSCSFDMTKFPIDQHVCDLEFVFSDQGHGNRLVVPVRNTNYPLRGLALYRENSEWELRNFTTFSVMKPYDLVVGNAPMELPTFVMRFEISRVSTYYFVNVITPLLLLTLLQVFVYFVPVESGEKLGFGITIMLSYTVFLLLLDGILPKTKTTPAVASFITAAMVLSSISLLLTSLIMRFHFTPEGTRMPACARAVFIRFLGRLFCVRGAKGAAVTAMLDQMPPHGVSESDVRKTDGATHADTHAAVGSDWIMAAHAIERLMVALGVIAIVAIMAVFIMGPYVH